MAKRIRVQFLGSGDAFGSGGRFQACIHVEWAGTRLLLDCGTSSLIAMQRFGVDPRQIDAVLVSHLHGDHFGGIPFFLLHAQYSGRTRPLLVAGPPGLEDRLGETMRVLFPGSTEVEPVFPVRIFEMPQERPVAVEDLTVTCYPAAHGGGAPAYLLRLEGDGRVLAYSGDTGWTDSLIPAAEGADLFICESYFYDTDAPFHLSYRTLLRERSRLSCRRLVLTHMSDEMIARLAEIEIECAADGKVIDL